MARVSGEAAPSTLPLGKVMAQQVWLWLGIAFPASDRTKNFADFLLPRFSVEFA
jgi:hypothetical protein